MKKTITKSFLKAYGIYFNIWNKINSQKAAKKAFQLFCTPRKGKVLPQQKAYLNDAKDDTIKVKDAFLEGEAIDLQIYRWSGKKENVLLLHGWESNVFRWRTLVQKLQEEDYNIVAFDAPAHGYSTGNMLNGPLYGECVQAAIEKYDPKYIIGHSFGGMALLYNDYKYANPGVEKMITLGSPSELSDFMAQYKSMLGLSTNFMDAIETYFIETFDMRFADFSSSKFARKVTKKGLLIHDEFDKVAPKWSSEQVHANWKNSTLIKTKGLGHSLHQDGVRDQIVNFLKS